MSGLQLADRIGRVAIMVLLLCTPLACGRDDARRIQLPAPATVAPLPSPATGAVFPLRIEPGKPYLIDASGRPYMVVGDSAWSILQQLPRSQIDAYLDDRHRRGFNAVLLNVIESHYAADPPRNSEGVAPFIVPERFASPEDFVKRVDYSTPNPRYFELLDYFVARASEKDMLVLAAPSYPGYLGAEQGWWVGMTRNSPSQLRQYGRFLGQRYRSQRNMLWVEGGDYDVPDRTPVREIAAGILELDPEKLHTFHGARGTGAYDWMAGETWLSLGNIYTREVVYPAAEKHFRERPGVPFILIEAYYEGGEGARPDPRLTRVEAYQAMLSGATGQLSGHNLVWQFKSGWSEALNSVTSRSMTQLAALFRSRPWWKLKPDLEHTLLTGGLESGFERAVAARAVDGSFAIVYTPTVRDLVIDTSQLAGPRVSARWMDPLTGDWLDAPGSPFARAPGQVLRPVRLNSADVTDWVLLLESSP